MCSMADLQSSTALLRNFPRNFHALIWTRSLEDPSTGGRKTIRAPHLSAGTSSDPYLMINEEKGEGKLPKSFLLKQNHDGGTSWRDFSVTRVLIQFYSKKYEK